MREVTVKTGAGKILQDIQVGSHHLVADEPPDVGDDQGLAPHELVAAGLGACTSMTLKLYAGRKSWPLAAVEVRITQEKRDDAVVFHRKIHLAGDLTDEQRTRLADIATRCPVAKTLGGTIEIEDELV